MFSQKLFEQITLPGLFLDVNSFDENCQQLAKKANGKTIRIATKSIRSVEILKRIMQSSEVYQGLMCYSPNEALYLAEKGFDNILLGYPCWDKIALSKIARINSDGGQIICMVDSVEQIDHLQVISEENNGLLYVCIDIDMSTRFAGFHFGVRRSPLTRKEEVLQIAKKIQDSKHLDLVGVMGYEAQIAGVSDFVPGQLIKNKAVAYLKKKSLHIIEERRRNIINTLRKAGIQLKLVNGGGTGSIDTTSLEEVVTEVTVGSGLYCPKLFDYYNNLSLKPALYFALPIVRQPTSTIFTCLGGGYISSGSIGKDKVPIPVYPSGGKLLTLEGAGEVQTPVYYENQNLKIGDAIVFRAAKAGEICERFKEIAILEDGKFKESYKTYRGDDVCFL